MLTIILTNLDDYKMTNRKESTKEKDWRKDITQLIDELGIGCLYKGYTYEPYQRHHVLGKSAKHNKIHIGYWFINPVPFELHDVNSNHEFNVTHHKKAFKSEYGNESEIFKRLIVLMKEHGYNTPPKEVIDAIMDTRA
jgi:hypothetical protein